MAKRTNKPKPVALIYELRLLANSMQERGEAGWSIIDRAVVEIARLASEVQAR